MDKYYAKLTRSQLMKAQTEISDAQEYLAEADAPEWTRVRLSKIMSSLRNLHDAIGVLADYQH